MIQRIQSIYLFLVVVLMAFVALCPYAVMGGITFDFCSFGLSSTQGGLVKGFLFLLVVLSVLLPLIAIFLYRKRMVQLRLCTIEFVLLFITQIFIVFSLWNTIGTAGVKYHVTAVFPIISMLLTWLAMRGITKDEVLVRSQDRIR